jgi:hypothetical protein
MKAHSATSAAILVSVLIAGCAQDGTLAPNGINTASIDQQATAAQAAKANPACVTLVSQIEALTKDGTADKVAKAAAKKYKLKPTDLAKADELNKANAEFQAKCSNYPPNPTVASPAPAPAGPKVAAKTKPPVPAPKAVEAALAPQQNTEAAATPAAEPPAQQ